MLNMRDISLYLMFTVPHTTQSFQGNFTAIKPTIALKRQWKGLGKVSTVSFCFCFFANFSFNPLLTVRSSPIPESVEELSRSSRFKLQLITENHTELTALIPAVLFCSVSFFFHSFYWCHPNISTVELKGMRNIYFKDTKNISKMFKKRTCVCLCV